MTYLESAAAISPCGLYRYTLTRVWDPARDPVVFCMLNPSTADGTEDDPTIRRCVAFADAEGYGRLTVVNLFAFRTAYPTDLFKSADPVGPDNDRHIAEAAAGRSVVCAWGATSLKYAAMRREQRSAQVLRLLTGRPLLCLGTTEAGHPMHPLYRPAATRFQAYVPEVHPCQS